MAVFASPLQLDTYLIDEITVKANPAFDPSVEEFEGKIAVAPQHLILKEDGNYHQLVLAVSYIPREDDETKLPYVVEITGRGFYRFEGSDMTADDQRQMLVLNGSSILYGLLRAEVAHVTALGRYGTMLLPTVNLVEAFRGSVLQATEPAE